MALFDNQNTFYNSTWHQYQVPTQFSRPVQLNLPWLQLPNYAQYQMNYANPYAVSSAQISPNLSQPIQSSRPKYNYDDIYYNGEPEDKESEEYKNAIARSEKFIDGFSKATNAATTILPALSGNTSTKLGNYAVGAGSILSEINHPIAKVAGNFLKLAGAAGNALIGSNLNEANIKTMNSAIQNRARQQFGDNSTTGALIAGSQNNIDLVKPEAKFYGTEGFLNRLRGVGKTYGLKWNNDKLIDQANQQARNTELLAYKDYQNKMIRNGLLTQDLYTIAALGGQLNTANKFSGGGGINKPYTHGSLFSNGLVEINNGGTHGQNPYGGIQYGVDEYGIPNLVEQGETISTGEFGGPEDYAFSDEILFPMKKYGHMFALGGITRHKKGKRNKKYTFADISKLLSKSDSLDKMTKDTQATNFNRLAMFQEEVKAEQTLAQMNPLDIMAALQQSPMANQMAMQEGMSEEAMAQEQQQPLMAACGGKLFANGGGLFTPYGNMYGRGGGVFDAIRRYRAGERKKPVNRSNSRLTRNNKIKNNQSKQTNKRSNYLIDENENKILNLPESTRIHNDVFGSAISNLLNERYTEYENLVKNKDYNGAAQIARKLASDINNVNRFYVQAMRNPTEENIGSLQTVFNDLGLNIDVDTYLKEHPEAVFAANGKPYKKDNPLDKINGMITQNRYFDFTDDDLAILQGMGLDTLKYIDFQSRFDDPIYHLGDNDMDFLKSISMVKQKDNNTAKVVRNPNYKEGSDEPEFIPIEQDIQRRYAPKDQDAVTWWENLPDDNKEGYYKNYGTIGDPTRTGVYDYQQVYGISEAAQQAITEAQKKAEAVTTDNKNNKYYTLKPSKNYGFNIAAGIAAKDYIDSQFGANSKPQNPGTDAAYSYLSKVGNIPMVRYSPNGTKLTYRPSDLNYELNNVRNDTFGMLRAIDNANMNHGYGVAAMMAALNQGRTAMSKARQQAFEEDLKTKQLVAANNNEVDKTNAMGSLQAQEANAQNIARAREAQAQGAIGLAGQLAQNYNNWLNYRNNQSSGLAQLFADRWQAERNLEQWQRYALSRNQQKDFLDIAGIPYIETIYNG